MSTASAASATSATNLVDSDYVRTDGSGDDTDMENGDDAVADADAGVDAPTSSYSPRRIPRRASAKLGAAVGAPSAVGNGSTGSFTALSRFASSISNALAPAVTQSESAAAAAADGMPVPPPSYKVAVFGRFGVGKTSLIERYVRDQFSVSVPATVGLHFTTTTLRLADGRELGLNIWDTAGQERYDSLSTSIMHDLYGAIVVFALDDRRSFEECASWARKVRSYGAATPILLVGNKLDLVDAAECARASGSDAGRGAAPVQRAVTERDVAQFVLAEHLHYAETSARTAREVLAVFRLLAALVAAHADARAREQAAIDAGARGGGGSGDAKSERGGDEFPDGIVSLERSLAAPRKRGCCAG